MVKLLFMELTPLELKGLCTQVPVAESQASMVEALLSSQLTKVFTHPVDGLHESVVQALLSSQLICVYMQPVAGSQ